MAVTDSWFPLVPAADVNPGEMHTAAVGDHRIVVYNVEGEFYATDNVCSHAYALLSDGWLEGHVIECPLHAGRFDVRNGKALCEPLTKDIASFATQIKDGRIEVLVPGVLTG